MKHLVNKIIHWQKVKHVLPVPGKLVICQDIDDEFKYFIAQFEPTTFYDRPEFCFRDYHDDGYDHRISSVKKWAYIKL